MDNYVDKMRAWALRGVDLADAIGCGWSTQGGGMPPIEDITRDLVKIAAEAHAVNGERRQKALHNLIARGLFALLLCDRP